jgi:site-specific DNA recombinase
MHPDLIQDFITEFQREMQQERLSALSERGENEQRLTKVRKDIDGLLTAITDGMYHSSMKAKMNTLQADHTRLEATLGALPEPEPVALHSGLAGVYAGKGSDLAEALNQDGRQAEAADLLRGLIETVVPHPDPDAPHGHRIELFGELAAILSLCYGSLAPKAKARTVGAGFWQVTVVAGTGFEPVTFRL